MKLALILSLLPGLLWCQSNVALSRKAPSDVPLTADPRSTFWRAVEGIVMQNDYFGAPVPNQRTEIRSRWTERHLYLLYICQFDQLNLKPDPTTHSETPRLWNWDVAEVFLGADFSEIKRYREFEVSPQGEWVDLDIDRSGQNRSAGAAWNSGMKVKAQIDSANKLWYAEMQIPLAALFSDAPKAGRELRAGFFRIAGTDPDKKKVSWQITGIKTFHVPEKFGILRLVE